MAGQKDRDIDHSLDFAVPGLDEEELGSMDQYQMSQDQTGLDFEDQDQDRKQQESGESSKEISLFYLLQHYNKENAAAYKLQKSRKKEGKQRKKTGRIENNRKTERGKREKNISRAPAVPVTSSAAQKQQEIEKKQKVQEDDFGVTVYVNRDSGRGMADDQTVHAKAALECPGYGQTVPVDRLPFTIGRSTNGVDLCIADNRTVGRRHAVISYRSGIFYIKDLNSLNHVFLNGRQIPPEKEIALKNHMKITLGNEELIFYCTDA